MKLSSLIQYQVSELASKLDGISHLLSNFASFGSGDRDNDRMMGLGTLVEGLANDGHRIAQLIDTSQSLHGDLEVDMEKYEYDPIGCALKAVEEARALRSVRSKTL